MIDDERRKLLWNMVLGGQAVYIAWAIVILDGRKTVMDAMPYLLFYTILMVVWWYLWPRIFVKTGQNEQMGTRKTQNVPALDTNEMPKCPCCGRPCYPVTDISGRQMCSWCGNYMRHRWRYGFYRNLLNYSNNIDNVVNMTDKKLLAFLIVCAAIMAGTVIQVTQHVSDGNSNNNGDGDTVGMQIRTGDAVANADPNATQTWTSGDCTCTLTDDGVFTVTGNGAMADYTIQPSPSMPWYSVREQIRSVVVDDGVMTIGRFAFNYCTSLTSVTIGNSVQTIGGSAFYECTSLASVTIGSSVQTIGQGTFQSCTSLASVTIPASVTSIGQGTFQSCTSLTNIFFLTTTWNITSIGSYAFSLGTSSASVNATVYSPNNVANGQLDAYKGSYTTLTYAPSVMTWTSGDCTCTLTNDGVFTVTGNGGMDNYSTPGGMPWSSVLRQIKSVVIDDGVTHIGNNTFYGCTALTSVTISDSVRSIGDWAFNGCTSLTSVTIVNSITTIGHGAFSGCTALASMIMPGSITFVGDYAFSGCTALTSVTMPDSITSVGEYVFYGCTSLANIFFFGTSWTITYIGSYAFSLGTSSVPVTATVHSPNNVANGQLDAYKGDYTTLTYVASIANTYTINVNDATYGSVSPTSVQIYDGTSVVADGNRLVFTDGQTVTATPAQTTAQYTYAFDSWTFGNLTQTANFTRTATPHTVTFQSSDASAGAVSPSTVTVLYGTTYSVNGNVMTFSDGQTVTATPSPRDVQYTYAFDSWSSASGTVEQDMTITANFTKTFNQYTVTIESNNTEYGSVDLTSVIVNYGASISTYENLLILGNTTITATPSPATAQYRYAFASWAGIPSEGMVTGDVTVTANFTRELVNYTVTFAVNNPDYGSVSPGSAVLPYGTTIEAASGDPAHLVQYPPDAQSRNLAQATPAASTEQYSYVFDSWSGIPDSVTGDVTITANFARHVSYKVTFAVNNAEFGSVQYDSLWIQEGSVPTVEGNTITFVSNAKQNTATASQATDAYFYLFESWTGVPQQITGDVTITAQFVRADKMNVDVLAKEVIDIDVSQRYSGATEHHQTDYGDWISLANGHLKGTVPADITDGHYYLVWWAKESLPRADWTAYYVMLHPTDSKTVQLSQDAEQTVHSDGKVQILGRGVMSNQMARLLDPYKDIVNVVDIRGLTTIQYMPAISNNYILVLGDSVTGFKDESNNHFDAVVIGAGINTFTVTGFHAYDKDGKEITGSALRGRVLIEQRTMQYEEIGITEVDNHYHNATCYAVQGSTLDNSENDRIKFSVTGAGSIPQYILDLLAHSGQSWNVEMQSGSSFKNVTIDTEGVLQGVQSNSVGTYTGTQSALFTNTDYGAMYSCTMSQAIAFQVFVQYKLVIN